MKLQRRLHGVKAFRFKVFVLVLFLVFYLLLVNIFVGPERSIVTNLLSKINGHSRRPVRELVSLPRTHIRRETESQPFAPGSFLKGEYPHNESYCWFKYGTIESFDWDNVTISVSPELKKKGPYRVIYNVIENMKKNEDSEPDVTYCTHVTPSFQCNILEIVRRWDGPVSIAAYVPDYDATLSLLLFQRMCQCIPEMSRVSVHFVFPEASPPVFPKASQMSFSSLESIDALIKFPADCSCPEAVLNGTLRTFREESGLTYPVNVARNVAREAAQTSHVLVSDVELLPSLNLVPSFRLLLKKYMPAISTPARHVFVLPVFEIEARVHNIPTTKEELQHLYSEGQAIYFHRWVCLHCQRFPGLERWLQRKKGTPFPVSPNVIANPSPLKPLLVVRREFPHHRWEPIYIGTRNEPLYSEYLSWEGRQDKMTQMHAMCLLGYRFVILDGGFLVHTPGMKRPGRKHAESIAWRQPHEEVNARLYEKIVHATENRLGSRPAACRLH
ncbi:beta-1,4-glucuronyltransferase 1 [Frankliniella occidentalis]|uniref:Beta-1,4-glucuronyltransferase 1 n=1 Tax=Frankliniella occidentalis TaxID=133901 RepID=A0A6J1SP29_FRAOC|nr:beta-1,4-glucuronyltransferase 1 [Frankliniella occidentalis]